MRQSDVRTFVTSLLKRFGDRFPNQPCVRAHVCAARAHVHVRARTCARTDAENSRPKKKWPQPGVGDTFGPPGGTLGSLNIDFDRYEHHMDPVTVSFITALPASGERPDRERLRRITGRSPECGMPLGESQRAREACSRQPRGLRRFFGRAWGGPGGILEPC